MKLRIPEIHESKEDREHQKKSKVEEKWDHEHPLGLEPPPLNVKHHHRVVEDIGNVLNGKIQEILENALNSGSFVDQFMETNTDSLLIYILTFLILIFKNIQLAVKSFQHNFISIVNITEYINIFMSFIILKLYLK